MASCLGENTTEPGVMAGRRPRLAIINHGGTWGRGRLAHLTEDVLDLVRPHVVDGLHGHTHTAMVRPTGAGHRFVMLLLVPPMYTKPGHAGAKIATPVCNRRGAPLCHVNRRDTPLGRARE
jgi:hypothetical protein